VEAAKEKLAEMEVDESFTQREEIQRHVHRQSDVEQTGASHSDDERVEFPDLSTGSVGDSHDNVDCYSNSNASASDDSDPQQKKSKASGGVVPISQNVTQYCTQNVKGKKTKTQLRNQVAVKRNEKKGKKGADNVNR
jgi:hypothetical protein